LKPRPSGYERAFGVWRRPGAYVFVVVRRPLALVRSSRREHEKVSAVDRCERPAAGVRHVEERADSIRPSVVVNRSAHHDDLTDVGCQRIAPCDPGSRGEREHKCHRAVLVVPQDTALDTGRDRRRRGEIHCRPRERLAQWRASADAGRVRVGHGMVISVISRRTRHGRRPASRTPPVSAARAGDRRLNMSSSIAMGSALMRTSTRPVA